MVCAPGLELAGIRRWVLVYGSTSMAEALELGRQAAGNGVVVYLHEDTRLLRPGARDELVELLGRYVVGVVAGAAGSDQRVQLPWWSSGRSLGMVHGSSATNPIQQVTPAGLLDGVALAQVGGWPWRPWPGWHGYDANRCLEAHARGLEVIVTPALEAAHYPPQKGDRYHNAHRIACRELAADWGLRCAI
jgi:hypothetical protein